MKSDPETPRSKPLDLRLPKQQASEWCWAAVSQGVALHFGLAPESQCEIVGKQFKESCCEDGRAGAGWGSKCNRPGYLHKVLERMEVLAQPPGTHDNKWVKGPVAFSVISTEIDAGRPICVLIRWRDDGRGHFIIIVGYSVSARGTPYVFVRNPLYPSSRSHHPYQVFASQSGDEGGYQDGQGVWAYSFLVKPPAGKR